MIRIKKNFTKWEHSFHPYNMKIAGAGTIFLWPIIFLLVVIAPGFDTYNKVFNVKYNGSGVIPESMMNHPKVVAHFENNRYLRFKSSRSSTAWVREIREAPDNYVDDDSTMYNYFKEELKNPDFKQSMANILQEGKKACSYDGIAGGADLADINYVVKSDGTYTYHSDGITATKIYYNLGDEHQIFCIQNTINLDFYARAFNEEF